MQFVVYMPGKRKPHELADVGLAGLVHDAWPKEIVDGPDGKRGTLFGWRAPAAKYRLYHDYAPASQVWIPAPEIDDEPHGRYWVGWHRDNPPTPDGMQRAMPYRSTKATLGDGNEWWFPAARSLPENLRYVAGGWAKVPMEQFEEFTSQARQWVSLLSQDVTPNVLLIEALEFVRLGFAINYRTCPEVESELGLWTTTSSGTVEPLMLDMLRSSEVMP